jgi:myo-inositol 2-dehydrogenase/D-chiro-inositol 1-dehydrogenase
VDKVRVGVVGGGVAGWRHLSRLTKREDIEVVGVADPSSIARSRVTRDVGVRTFKSADELFEHASMDGVFLCLPPNQHGRAEELAVMAGVALFIEKPLAVDLGTAERLCDLIQHKVPAMVGYQWRQLSFLPLVQEALRNHPINMAIGTWMDPPAKPAWWGSTSSAGGQFVEQATHLIDLAIALNGPMSSVVGDASDSRLGNSREGFSKGSAALCRFENGSIGIFAATCVLAETYDRSLELFGDGIAVNITEETATITSAKGQMTWDHVGGDLYEREHSAFVELARDGLTALPTVDYAQALLTHRAACAMERSLLHDHRIMIA